ncbi:MAG: hypothetical protein AAF821_14895 [Cyanobacteria bacterium P01_D01_bin.156]
MKTYILSALTVLMAAATVVPAAQALETSSMVRTQVSTPEEISEDATFHDLVLHNRSVRNKR